MDFASNRIVELGGKRISIGLIKQKNRIMKWNRPDCVKWFWQNRYCCRSKTQCKENQFTNFSNENCRHKKTIGEIWSFIKSVVIEWCAKYIKHCKVTTYRFTKSPTLFCTRESLIWQDFPNRRKNGKNLRHFLTSEFFFFSHIIINQSLILCTPFMKITAYFVFFIRRKNNAWYTEQ